LKFLVDNQLPKALAVFLSANGLEAARVRQHRLAAATGDFAKASGFVIVTMDEDFQHLSARYGPPPQVVWVRLGNVRKQALLATFTSVLPELHGEIEMGTAVIEIA